MQNRTLYFGDNLEILREKISDESFDLIYLDPPFSSNRDYNILFNEGLQENHAQVQAFEDSWHWTQEAEKTFEQLIGIKESKTKINQGISDLMIALEKIIGRNDVLAYLTMMTVRLIELKRVLKNTGSLYLHCDPTASHYLKIILDVVFGKKKFRNEIVWCYKERELSKKYFNKKHDIIFFYTKSDQYTFNTDEILEPYSEGTIRKFNYTDEQGRKFQIRGKGGKYVGKQGLSIELEKTDPNLVYKDYLDKSAGILPRDWWTIPFINRAAKERLGYPTQKPEALLERIVKASSNEGDWVLDPFCGCGTTVAVAERLNRKWIGIDITALAINLIKHRLDKQFEDKRVKIYVDGLPKDLTGARALTKKDPFEFEYWACDLIGAMPAQSKTKEKMRGADKGIDGVITIVRDVKDNKIEYGKLLVQVKSGKVKRSDIATLKGDIEREKADGGVFITLEEPTRPMREEAVSAGMFTVSYSKHEFAKIQIITIKELLNGKRPNIPLHSAKPYYKEAKKDEVDESRRQKGLGL